MNDRFRFRVWDKNKKFMIYDAESDFRYVDRFGDFLQYPEDYEIMQCTGLKDNNGKLIYEGDILKYYQPYKEFKLYKQLETTIIQIVEWDDIYPVGFAPFMYNAYTDDDSEWYEAKNNEVIGNIYENKELLQESEVKN